MLKNLYVKFRDLAASKYAGAVLAFVSFYDGCLFPTPPELMLMPATAMKPQKAWQYALIATVFSILGGIVGYFIGLFLMDTIGHQVLAFIGLDKKLPMIQAFYMKWGTLAILLKGLTPFPFLIISIFSGSVKFPFWIFVSASFVTRAARFFLVAGLTKIYGPQIEEFIEKKLYWVTGAIAIVIIAAAAFMARH